MTDTEKKDLYIAAAVGGLGLILVFAYIHSGTLVSHNGEQIPAAEPSAPVVTPYNYNVAPYNPRPALQLAKPGSMNKGGCCDDCGVRNGAQYFNPTVAQFQTLIGA